MVQLAPEPIGAVLNRIRDVFSYLGSPSIKQAHSNNTVIFRFMSESLPQSRLRLKIEINCHEHMNILGLAEIPFTVRNPWFTGNSTIITYTIEELIASKIRALYQRKKGRDLFDIYYAHTHGCIDAGSTVFSYKRYMANSPGYVPSAKQYMENLTEKLNDPAFRADLVPLLRPSIEYDIQEAYEGFVKHFISIM